jgi:hypothetical protein
MKKIILLLIVLSITTFSFAQKKSKHKNSKTSTDALVETVIEVPKPDTASKFIGIIKYRITTDDAADRDSMYVIFGENQIRITMFIPGYRADQIFENNMIARFSDSMLLTLDPKTKTVKKERLSARNAGTEFSLSNSKKVGNILSFPCQEFAGDMTMKDGEMFEASCLLSKQHSFITGMNYNFLNIQPVVVGYKIVLGYRTRTSANENTYIMAYKIEPGPTDAYFDLSQYKIL